MPNTISFIKSASGTINSSVSDESAIMLARAHHIFDIVPGTTQLFNKEDAIFHFYFNENCDIVVRDDMSGAFIPIEPGASYVVGTESTWDAFCNSDFVCISPKVQTIPGTVLVAPNEAAYLYVSTASDKLDTVVVNKGTNLLPKETYFSKLKAQPKKFGAFDGYKYFTLDTPQHSSLLFDGKDVKGTNYADGYFYGYTNGVKAFDDTYRTFDITPAIGRYVIKNNFVGHVCLWNNDVYVTGFLINQSSNGVAFNVDGIIVNRVTISVVRTSGEGNLYAINNIAKNTSFIRLPKTYTPYGKPSKLCIVCHGATNGISSDSGWTTINSYNRLIDSLVNSGYAVIDSNGYDDSDRSGHEHWGAPQALSAYVKAYQYAIDNYNLDTDIYVYGFSMGGLTALNLAIDTDLPIKCISIGCPVISLKHQAENNADLLKAYDINVYSEDRVRGYDRFLDITTIGEKDYVLQDLPPVLIGYGSTDTNVSNDDIKRYANAIAAANGCVRLKEYVGGHSISYGESDDFMFDTVSWFNNF